LRFARHDLNGSQQLQFLRIIGTQRHRSLKRRQGRINFFSALQGMWHKHASVKLRIQQLVAFSKFATAATQFPF